MPRARLVLLIWTIGTVLLLGLWGHSLFRKSVLSYRAISKERHADLGIVAGSVEIVWGKILSRSPNSFRRYSYPLEKDAMPGPVPTYKLGRFFYQRFEVSSPHPLFKVTIEFPIWSLLLLYTLLCLPFYLRYRKRQDHHPEEPPAPQET